MALMMDAESEPKFCDSVEKWLSENASRLGWHRIQYARDMTRGTVSAGYELPGLLISIAAWDQGSCLDIDVLVKATGATHMLGSGPCDQPGEMVKRLEALIPWVAEHPHI
jgi:hypothetical protein